MTPALAHVDLLGEQETAHHIMSSTQTNATTSCPSRLNRCNSSATLLKYAFERSPLEAGQCIQSLRDTSQHQGMSIISQMRS